MLISRQVDDLAIGCSNAASIRKLVAIICDEDKIDLRDEGILDSFNGVDVKQTRSYIQITCESYIDKFLEHYGWSAAACRESGEKPIEPLALSTIPQLFLDYDANTNADATTLNGHEIVAGFPYRSMLGAIIYVYVVARIDIGFAVTLLARFSDHPVKIHFDSLRRLARYPTHADEGLGHHVLATRSHRLIPARYLCPVSAGPDSSCVSTTPGLHNPRWIC
jgi:hypothetical protein